MATALFGLEAELAVSAMRDGRPLGHEFIAGALSNSARQTLTHLKGPGTRLYLASGGLFYIDHGYHPEVATPECTTPWEAVCHLRAAERTVDKLARHACEELQTDRVHVYRNNVDYLARSTWGCHESYLGRQPLDAYTPWLLPHLVSRILYTGSGGLDPFSPGVRFSLSPRVSHLKHVTGNDSTATRGIIHTRDEPLSQGYCRVHILAGDNTCSQRATWLKVGSTALVLAMADADPPGARWLRLIDPLGAMHGFARDPRIPTLVAVGHAAPIMMTALDIQRHILDRIVACAPKCEFPDWTDTFCAVWRETLDLLDSDAAAHSHAFDWPLKFALMRHEIARRGYCDQSIAAWSEALEHTCATSGMGDWPGAHLDRIHLNAMERSGRVTRAQLKACEKNLARHGLHLSDLDEFTALRNKLCEIDVRFGEMGDGLFDTLDRQNALPDHRMASEAQIEAAADTPPAHSRAALRGRWVRRLAPRCSEFICDWTSIAGPRVTLDLRDPFAVTRAWERGKWRPMVQSPPHAMTMLERLVQEDEVSLLSLGRSPRR